MARTSFTSSVLLIVLSSPGFAQEHVHAQGERLGTVHFATSCTAAAQPQFDRAVGDRAAAREAVARLEALRVAGHPVSP